jgi:response regulator of citrate/malate metabolism
MDSNSNRVLIVEDDLSLMPFWSLILRRCLSGAKIDWAVSCEQAKEFLSQADSSKSPYAMIITDIFLAGSDTGIDLLNSAEAQNSVAPKVLVTSADEHAVNRSYNWENQSVSVLAKPLSVPKCERLLESILAC